MLHAARRMIGALGRFAKRHATLTHRGLRARSPAKGPWRQRRGGETWACALAWWAWEPLAGTLPLFRDHPEVERLALCDVDAERLAWGAQHFGVSECYPDMESLLHSDVDGVVLITQPWLHQQQALAALRAGKHVYSAVPAVCGDDGGAPLEQLDALVRAVERSGLSYMLGETSLAAR